MDKVWAWRSGGGVYINPIIENRLKCDVASRTEYSEKTNVHAKQVES